MSNRKRTLAEIVDKITEDAARHLLRKIKAEADLAELWLERERSMPVFDQRSHRPRVTDLRVGNDPLSPLNPVAAGEPLGVVK